MTTYSTDLLMHLPAIHSLNTVSNSKVSMIDTRNTSNVLQDNNASLSNKQPQPCSLLQQLPLLLLPLKVTLWIGNPLSLMPTIHNISGPTGSAVKKLNNGSKMDAASNAALPATELASAPSSLHNVLQLRLLKSLQMMSLMLFWKVQEWPQHHRKKSSSCAKSPAGARDRSVTKVLVYLQPGGLL